jgi:LysM repeat protein
MARRGARPRHGRFSRYAAPLAFLTAVTIAVLLVASALKSDDTAGTKTTTTVATSRKTTTKPGKRKPRPPRYYVVVAGDTFEVIAGKTGVSVETLERLNPDVSTTSLHVGQKLRVA